MNALVAVCFAVSMAVSQASVIGLGGAATLVGPANPGASLVGPAAQASLVGPDGSHIVGAAQAGALAAAPIPGGVVSAAVAPGVVAHGGLIAPGLGLGLGLGHGAVLAAPAAVVGGWGAHSLWG